MSVLYGILLGIIQGITEFLPVSSFGHMCAMESMLGINRSTGILLEVLLHVGTLAAVVFAFGKDVRRVFGEGLSMLMDIIGNGYLFVHNRRTGAELHYTKIISNTYRKFTVMLVLSNLATLLLGSAAKRLVVKAALSPIVPGAGLLITGIFLLVTDFSNAGGTKTPKDATYDSALWIGICQGLAVFPGISSLGLTLCAGLLCGFNKKFAIKYALLVSFPATLGAFFMEIGKFASPGMSVGLGFTYLISAIIAGLVGCLVIRFMVSLIQNIRMRFFAFYCFIAGAVMLFGNVL